MKRKKLIELDSPDKIFTLSIFCGQKNKKRELAKVFFTDICVPV